MSRAEKFIGDCTRNCSNEVLRNGNKSFTNIPCKGEYNPWLTPDQARKAVEIAREEVIEKVCNFVTEKLFFNDNMLYTNIKSKIVEDLKQAMKDE